VARTLISGKLTRRHAKGAEFLVPAGDYLSAF